MGYRDGVKYESTKLFSEEQLVLVVPLEVLNWMKFRMWGTIDPAITRREGKVPTTFQYA